MKALLLTSLLFSATAFSQTLDVNALKNLMTQKKELLESVHQGMRKQILTSSKIPTELGPCEIKEEVVQTVLKLEGDKMIIFSRELYTPASTPACAGFEFQAVSVLFYEDKPTLAQDLKDLDEVAQSITSIQKSADLVTVNLKVEGQPVTVKYDFSKPSFKNTLFFQDSESKIETLDMSDIDVRDLDLKDVLFCESADSDDCSQGDFSDILYF